MKEDFKKAKSSKKKRTFNLIADFTDGYASGWRFAVPGVFKDALDIKWIGRAVPILDDNGNEVMISDSKRGQQVLNKDGTPKLKKKTEIKYFWLQGEPPDFDFKPGSILYDTRLAYELSWVDALKHIKLSVQILDAIPNETLIFNLYRPKKDFSAVEKVERIECFQDDFVSFLRSGILLISSGKSRDLFREYGK